jgi:hypothetical protein
MLLSALPQFFLALPAVRFKFLGALALGVQGGLQLGAARALLA